MLGFCCQMYPKRLRWWWFLFTTTFYFNFHSSGEILSYVSDISTHIVSKHTLKQKDTAFEQNWRLRSNHYYDFKNKQRVVIYIGKVFILSLQKPCLRV